MCGRAGEIRDVVVVDAVDVRLLLLGNGAGPGRRASPSTRASSSRGPDRALLGLLGLGGELDLDLVFFFGARARRRASLFAFDRERRRGSRAALTASARSLFAGGSRRRPSTRPRSRRLWSAPHTFRVVSELSAWHCCAECHGRAAATASYGQQAKCAGSLLDLSQNFYALGPVCSTQRPRTNLKSISSLVSYNASSSFQA